MSLSMRSRGSPIARLAPTPRTGSDGGYPWVDGELLYAADLNAAVAGISVSVLTLGAKGDGVTDDTVAIQAALNTYAGKATVFVPDTGNSYICGPLTIPSDTDLLLLGTLLRSGGASANFIYIGDNVEDVTIRGTGTIDGNKASNPGSGGGVYANASSNIFISGITIQHANLWNLNIVACSHVRVDGISSIGGTNSNEFAQGSGDCWLTNSLIDGPDGDGGFAFYGGVTNSGAIGNIIRNSGIATHGGFRGLYILSDSAQTAACKGIVLANNIIYNCGGSGIFCDSASGNEHQDILIANNMCKDNGVFVGAGAGDIGVSSSLNVLIIGNQSLRFATAEAGGSAEYGIYTGAATGVSVISNTVGDTGQGGSNGVGLYVQGTNTLLATGNHFYNLGSEMVTSIGGNAGIANQFVGNLCDRPITIVFQPDSVAANDVQGVWTVQGLNYSFSRNSSTKDWTFVDSGNTNVTIGVDGSMTARTNIISLGGLVRAQGYEDISSNQLLGSRITGWGISTGGVRAPITAGSSLPQVAAALAQLLTDLQAHGMIGQ